MRSLWVLVLAGAVAAQHRNLATVNAPEIAIHSSCVVIDTSADGTVGTRSLVAYDAYWWHLRLLGPGITTWAQCKAFCRVKLDSLGFNVGKVRDILLGNSGDMTMTTAGGDTVELRITRPSGGVRPVVTPVGWAIEVDRNVARRWCHKFLALKAQYPNKMDFLPRAAFADSMAVWYPGGDE